MRQLSPELKYRARRRSTPGLNYWAHNTRGQPCPPNSSVPTEWRERDCHSSSHISCVPNAAIFACALWAPRCNLGVPSEPLADAGELLADQLASEGGAHRLPWKLYPAKNSVNEAGELLANQLASGGGAVCRVNNPGHSNLNARSFSTDRRSAL